MTAIRRRLVESATLLALLAVLAVVLHMAQRPSVQTVESYRLTADPSSISAHVTTGRHDKVVKSFATETSDQVVVSVLVRRSWQASSTSEGYPKDIAIYLDRPLGSRSVVDAKSGLLVVEEQSR